MTTEYLGISGDAATAKLFLGDSSGYGDSTLGLYGSLAERKKVEEKLAAIQGSSTPSTSSDVIPGSGAYSRPTNRPINNR